MICPRCNSVMHKESYAFYWCVCKITAKVNDGGTTIFYDENENVFHPRMENIERILGSIEKEIDDWKRDF